LLAYIIRDELLTLLSFFSEQEAFQFKLQGQLFALYASRTPDFFFGSTFCAPIPAVNDGNQMVGTGSNIFPSPFFSGQQIFDQPFATVPQPVHGQMSPQHNSFCVKSCTPNSLPDRQGRNDTLRALKRKIQENFTTCKPTKIPRITQHQNGGFGIGRLSPTSVLNSETVVGQHLSSSMNSFTVPSYNDHGPMQMLYSSRDIQQTLTQKKAAVLSDRIYKPLVKMEDKNNNEQVVPDVSMPSCYLTPEASPVSSPQPSKTTTTSESHSFDPVLVAKYICSLKQKHQMQPALMTEAERKAKNLPSLDVTFVDSFFDELSTFVAQNISNIQKNDSVIKTEPIDIDDLVDEKESDSFDVEDILALSDPESEKNGGKLTDVKLKFCEDQFNVPESHTSPLPLSPISSITEDRVSCDDMSYCALTPESDFDSDQYDEIMDPDNWMLQTLKMPSSAILPELDKYGNTPMVSVDANVSETELHQLRKFISSWTPSGRFTYILMIR
jgi:hypothetical protein